MNPRACFVTAPLLRGRKEAGAAGGTGPPVFRYFATPLSIHRVMGAEMAPIT